MLNDSELLRNWIERSDEGALRDLFSRHRPVIEGACRRILRDPAGVEDAAQETFIALARDAAGITGEAGAWLRGVAVCKALKLRDSARRRTRRELTASSSVVTEEDPETDLVDSCIELLSEAERDLIVRHFYLGQTQKHIAEDSGLTPLVVHRRMKSALNQLKQMLTGKGVRLGSTAALVAILARAGASEASVVGSAAGVQSSASSGVESSSIPQAPASGSEASPAPAPAWSWRFAGWGVAVAVGSIVVLLYFAREDGLSDAPSPVAPENAAAAPAAAPPTAGQVTPVVPADAPAAWLVDRATFAPDDWKFLVIDGVVVGHSVTGMDFGDDQEVVALHVKPIELGAGRTAGCSIDLPDTAAIKILPKGVALPSEPAMLFELEVVVGDAIDTVHFSSVVRASGPDGLHVSTRETHRRSDGAMSEKLIGYAAPEDRPQQFGLVLTGRIVIRNMRFRFLSPAESQEVVARVAAEEARAEAAQAQPADRFDVPEIGD